MIHCALCINDRDGNYFIYPHTVVIAILHNASRPVCFHIIADETLPPERRKLLEDLAAARGGKVIFYTAPQVSEEVLSCIRNGLGVGAIYRLFLHEVVPQDKLLYLDCDIAVNMDLAELYDIDLGEHYLAAVEEPNLTYSDKFHGLRGFPKLPDRYFNSGVLLMNLRKFRELCAERNILLDAFVEHDATRVFNDQDVLNGVLASIDDSVMFIDEKYNYMINTSGRMLESLQELRGKIIHYILTKPLNTFYPAALLFWKYCPLSDGQPRTEVFEAMEKIPTRKEIIYCRNALYTRKNAAKFRRYYDLNRYGLLWFIKKRLFPKKYKR